MDVEAVVAAISWAAKEVRANDQRRGEYGAYIEAIVCGSVATAADVAEVEGAARHGEIYCDIDSVVAAAAGAAHAVLEAQCTARYRGAVGCKADAVVEAAAPLAARPGEGDAIWNGQRRAVEIDAVVASARIAIETAAKTCHGGSICTDSAAEIDPHLTASST